MAKLDEKKLQEKIGWSPYFPKKHKPQIKILEGMKRYTVIMAGVRGGKTAIAAYMALRELLKSNRQVWIVAPTYDLAMRTYQYIADWLGKGFPGSIQEGAIRMSARIGSTFIENVPQNSWIKWKSADSPTSLLGEELNLIIDDEASRQKKEIWESYLYPRLASRQGSAVFISTPFGQNWFWQEGEKAKKLADGAFFHFESRDNPYFPDKEWERAKKRLPEQVFKQEYMALALQDAASVFRKIDDIISDRALSDAIKDHSYTMGVDLGKHEDFTVLTVIDTYNNNVVYWDRFKDIEYPFQKKRISATAKRYNNARMIIDSTVVGEPIKEDLERNGLFVDDFKFTNKSKKELVEKLSIFIEQKKIFIPNKEILIDELKAFGYQLTEHGNVIYKAPEGLHDDAVFSLALAVWGLTGEAKPKTGIEKRLEKKRYSTDRNYI